MRPLGILVTGDPVEGVARTRGTFADLLRAGLSDAWDGDFRLLDARRGQLPKASELAALLITGSPESVTSRAPWILETEATLRALVAEGVPTLGVCFGHQLLAQALGGHVEENPHGREMGTVELCLHVEDPILAGLPQRFATNMSHRDSATRLPEGAVRLASTSREQNAFVRFGERAFGMQFHPEFDAGVMRGYIEARTPVLTAEGIDPGALIAEDAPIAAELLRRFGRLVQQLQTRR
jgi:GMP synthase (glutamine-hydrolysing)